ncbi:hypothetical protein SAMN04487967_3594 [Natronorubrum sediminis]|uniref:Uncharacterized protein n=1 Tax=Natronorubrum sediminis TaxID=640943 RepID=A0A1H6G4V4_9EURY|nr:hypothetical protein SAMN04487967_3594 [Natronorubrum sediminis]
MRSNFLLGIINYCTGEQIIVWFGNGVSRLILPAISAGVGNVQAEMA